MNVLLKPYVEDFENIILKNIYKYGSKTFNQRLCIWLILMKKYEVYPVIVYTGWGFWGTYQRSELNNGCFLFSLTMRLIKCLVWIKTDVYRCSFLPDFESLLPGTSLLSSGSILLAAGDARLVRSLCHFLLGSNLQWTYLKGASHRRSFIRHLSGNHLPVNNTNCSIFDEIREKKHCSWMLSKRQTNWQTWK